MLLVWPVGATANSETGVRLATIGHPCEPLAGPPFNFLAILWRLGESKGIG